MTMPDRMTMKRETFVLTCHPTTPCQVAQRIQAEVRRPQNETLVIAFALEGDLSELCIPQYTQSCRGDCLWQHTCFEAFVAVKGKQAYHEFNFALSGEWAVYAFQHYRDGGPLAGEEFVPQINVQSMQDRLELDAVIALDRLSSMLLHAPLLLGLSAVIEEKNGTLSYWALRHPGAKPDFHHPDAFVLEIESPPLDETSDLTYTRQR